MNSFTLYKNPRRQASGYLHLTEGAGHKGTQLAAVQVVFISRRSRARLLCCGTSNGGLGTQLTSMCTGFLQQQQRTFLVWVLPETSCHAVTPIPLVSQPLGQGSCSRGQCRCGEKQPGCVLQTFHCYHFRSVMLLAHILSVANFYLLKKLEDYIKQLEGVGFESKKLNMPPEFLMSVFEWSTSMRGIERLLNAWSVLTKLHLCTAIHWGLKMQCGDRKRRLIGRDFQCIFCKLKPKANFWEDWRGMSHNSDQYCHGGSSAQNSHILVCPSLSSLKKMLIVEKNK